MPYQCNHKDRDGNYCWKFTGFYGHPESVKQEESWTLLKHLKSHAPVPWLCTGGFNEILDHSKKEGAAIRRESQIDDFRITLEECQLCDLGYTGPKFSWSNKRKDATFTKERLGHAVANKEWRALFQVVFVTILASCTSDHNPIYVQFSEQPSEWQSYKWGFKFEDSWNTDDDTFFTNFSAFYKVLNLMFLLYHAFSIIYSNYSGPNGVENYLRHLERRVMGDMNDSLLRPFTKAEVSFALSQMHPFKSPGSDGFAACFYQKSWATVGKVVSQAVLHYLNGGPFNVATNSTNIMLIPKFSSPSWLTNYRPISLSNVLYKLIAKVLVNRLKLVLPHAISPEQSAFILGRLITDNILVAFETLHTMDTRLKGNEGFMALKLNMRRIWNKINGWKEKFLLHDGKEILLKAVIQAIPTYTMSVFKLPKSLSRDINSSMAKFWWGHQENVNKNAWMSWSRLGKNKGRGGLEYRELESFNLALLVKQG
ncbi:uncharacterized protein LOC133860363 [Alnus glutinosa]|uniref:uncharacterized protein LOC133860363 n=1 Tax=Alnus glutinosa TaxID=3517 RepID=UPI002D785742|nr:uncharacterized protein LOC133860363 [Alnus glutinosa]